MPRIAVLRFTKDHETVRDEQTVTSEPAYEWEDITREFGKKVHVD